LTNTEKEGTDNERIQAPTVSISYQSQNAAEIVREDYRRKPAAIDERGDLENLFLLYE
jgi:hypothetical protein